MKDEFTARELSSAEGRIDSYFAAPKNVSLQRLQEFNQEKVSSSSKQNKNYKSKNLALKAS